ncbi:hypothetical protein [Streptomyces sp. NPDC099088]
MRRTREAGGGSPPAARTSGTDPYPYSGTDPYPYSGTDPYPYSGTDP